MICLLFLLQSKRRGRYVHFKYNVYVKYDVKIVQILSWKSCWETWNLTCTPKSLTSFRLVSQGEQSDYSLIDRHAYVIICSPFAAMLSRSSCAGHECCLHLRKNRCFLAEGSERLHKEEASDEDEDTEFFDAMEDSPAFITVTATENIQHRLVAHSLTRSLAHSQGFGEVTKD